MTVMGRRWRGVGLRGLAAWLLATGAADARQDDGGLADRLDFAQVDPLVRRAFQWRFSGQHGYQVAGQVFAEDGVDWALASALETALVRRLEELVASGDDVTLAGRRRSTVRACDADGLTLEDRRGEHAVTWAEVEGRELVTLLRRRQDKDATDQLALAALAGVTGDGTNQQRALRELEAEALAAAERWQAASAGLAEEVAALAALEAAWQEDTAAGFVAAVDRSWAAVASTALAQALREPMAQRYEAALRESVSGEQVLAELLHGEWTSTPAADGAVSVEATWTFEEEAPRQDLRPGPLPKTLAAGFRFLVPWWEPAESWTGWSVEEGTCWGAGDRLVFLDLPLAQVEELQVTGIVRFNADPQEFLRSFLSFGLYDDATGHYLATYNQWRLVELGAAGTRPSGHRDVETKAGAPLVARLRWAESMLILERDGETMSRLSQPEVRSGRPFLAVGGHACWGVQEVFLKGTVTAEHLEQEVRRHAQERARARFAVAER